MVALLLALLSPAHARDKVAVVVSDVLSAYTDPVSPFVAELGQSAEVINIHGRETEARQAIERLDGMGPKVVYCIGAKACYAVHKAMPKMPLVYSTIYEPRRYGIEGDKVTGVTMRVEPITFLSQFTGLFPSVKSIGVVRGPEMSDGEWLELAAAGVELDLAVVDQRVREARDVRSAMLLLAKKEVDAVWVPPDRSILTSENYRNLTEEARRRRLPLLVDTRNMVEAGGLYTLAPDAQAVGQQAARLVQRILDGERPGDMRVQDPEKLLVVLNAATIARAELEFDRLLLDFVDVVVD
jgi:putative tryptophan/tyrosine transport system substrate-binding protein